MKIKRGQDFIQKSIIIFTLLFIPVLGWSQNIDTLSAHRADKNLSHHPENRDIGLSHITSDIITFSQLADVREVTIENMADFEVISYDLTYFIPERNSVSIFTGSGKTFPEDLIQEIIASGSGRILLENIVISRKGEKDYAGFRNFYVN